MLIAAFSAFAEWAARRLRQSSFGKHDYDRAELILGNSAGLLVIFSVVLTIAFSIFKTPVLYAFQGTSETTIQYAESYIGIYLLGTIFVQFAVGLNTFISGQEKPGLPCLVLIGAIINICLDPVFIFVFGMGVKGSLLWRRSFPRLSAAWVIKFLPPQKA